MSINKQKARSSQTPVATSAHCEYFEDFSSPLEFPRDINDVERGSDLVVGYLRSRVDSVLSKFPGTPVSMLSGGIDSILVTAVLAEVRPDTVAYTFSYLGESGAGAEELERAKDVCSALGIEHKSICPGPSEAHDMLTETVKALDHADAWEVLAGVVNMAVDQASARDGLGDSAIFTGDAADILFFGDKYFSDHKDPVEYLNEVVAADVRDKFTRGRQIPDFYERLMDNHERHIKTWQTELGFHTAARLRPEAIRGEDLSVDKAVERVAARNLGVPEELTQATKSPMQKSSGAVTMATEAAAFMLKNKGVHDAYSDPAHDSDDMLAARLYFEVLRSTS